MLSKFENPIYTNSIKFDDKEIQLINIYVKGVLMRINTSILQILHVINHLKILPSPEKN